jgi:ubiquinone/menaquinone biosynthesis C-methylase UbiE
MGFYSRYLFAPAMDWMLSSRLIQNERRLALAEVRGNVLEIGFGTGLNLPCYPEGVSRLTGIDLESMLSRRVRARIAKVRFPVEQKQLDAGTRLPFDDQTFDTVVTTCTLCSIADVATALGEMQRVLKSSGRYVFLEHGLSSDPGVAKWQHRLNPLQNLVACGCNMNRPIDRLIEAAGFTFERMDRFVMHDVPRVLATMYRGAAVRP